MLRTETENIVGDQLSKPRPRASTGLSEGFVEHKPVQAQRKRSQQARYQVLEEARFKEQKSCGGLKPCGTGMPNAATARVVAAMGGLGALQAAKSFKEIVGHQSGVVKLYPELDPQSKRSRAQVGKEVPRIVAARLKVEAASIRTSTSSKSMVGDENGTLNKQSFGSIFLVVERQHKRWQCWCHSLISAQSLHWEALGLSNAIGTIASADFVFLT